MSQADLIIVWICGILFFGILGYIFYDFFRELDSIEKGK